PHTRRPQHPQLRAPPSNAPAVPGLERTFGDRLDAGKTVSPSEILFHNPEAFNPTQDEVVAAIGGLIGMCDHPAPSDWVHGRPTLVLVFPAWLQQHHSNQPVAGERVGDHLAIAR